MAYFIPRPAVQELYQFTGDMDAMHAWLDPQLTRDQAAGTADPDFVVDTDPDTGVLRFTQWGYYFYVRVNDFIAWQWGNVSVVGCATDGNPVGMEPTDLGPAPDLTPGYMGPQAVPEAEVAPDAAPDAPVATDAPAAPADTSVTPETPAS